MNGIPGIKTLYFAFRVIRSVEDGRIRACREGFVPHSMAMKLFEVHIVRTTRYTLS